MNEVIITEELRTRLQGLAERTAFRDEAGQALGLFLPVAEYKKLLASVQVPFSAAEIERRRQETGGCSLEEFWQKMGSR